VAAVIGGVGVECVLGDIAGQTGFDAVVNAANRDLLPGGGVAGAIHRAAGPELAAACRPLAPIRPGQAVLTQGFRLPNAYVIHCLGPVYGIDEPSAEILAQCYRNILALADGVGVASVATPAISTGVFGYPMAEAARVAMAAIASQARDLRHVRRIRFVLAGAEALRLHESALRATSTPPG
jgi:O-acetyl-ADP-ribose deacetylase (regulator of RNase III)